MKLIFLNTYIIAVKETSKPSEPSAHYLCLLPLTLVEGIYRVPYMGFWVPSTGFKKQDGGFESKLSPIYGILSPVYGILSPVDGIHRESRRRDSESRRRDGIRDNPVYGILSPTYGILGFTVYVLYWKIARNQFVQIYRETRS